MEDSLFSAVATEDVFSASAAATSHRNHSGLDDVEQRWGIMQGVVGLHSFPPVSECVIDDDDEYGCCLKRESDSFQDWEEAGEDRTD